MDKTRAFQRAVDAFPLGTQALAAALDMSPTTLRHKASPTYPTQFFSPEEGIRFQHTTGDHGPLQVEAAALGYVLLRCPELLDGDAAVQLVTSTVREVSEYLTECTSSLADGRVTRNELDNVDRELTTAIAAMQALRAHLAAMHEQAKPVHADS